MLAVLLSSTYHVLMWALPYSAAGDTIPIEQLDAHVVEMYIKDTKLGFQEIFLPLKKLCKRRKVGFFSFRLYFANLDCLSNNIEFTLKHNLEYCFSRLKLWCWKVTILRQYFLNMLPTVV